MVSVVRFSADGSLAATGSADHSIKLLNVSKARDFYETRTALGRGNNNDAINPMLRLIHAASAKVTDLDFHPVRPYLISSSRDCSI